MSQENVEIVRRGYDAYARGDVAAMLADIDSEMVTYREEPDGATVKGRNRIPKRCRSPRAVALDAAVAVCPSPALTLAKV